MLDSVFVIVPSIRSVNGRKRNAIVCYPKNKKDGGERGAAVHARSARVAYGFSWFLGAS